MPPRCAPTRSPVPAVAGRFHASPEPAWPGAAPRGAPAAGRRLSPPVDAPAPLPRPASHTIPGSAPAHLGAESGRGGSLRPTHVPGPALPAAPEATPFLPVPADFEGLQRRYLCLACSCAPVSALATPLSVPILSPP